MEREHRQVAEKSAWGGDSLISYACDVTWLTHRAQGKVQLIHFTMAKHGGKTCAAGAPGGISCTNNSYTPNVSIHIFPKNEKVRDQWVKFVNVHRPDWRPTSNSTLCSVHFHESCFTRFLPSTNTIKNKIITLSEVGKIDVRVINITSGFFF